MTNSERSKFKTEIEAAAKECLSCKDESCILRPLMLYINDKGLDYFEYQYDNDKLPEAVQDSLSAVDLILDLDLILRLLIISELLDF